MTTYARIAGGFVAEIIPTTAPLNTLFSPQFVLSLVDVTSVTPAPQVGWPATDTNGVWTFTAPAAPPTPTLAQQAQAALDAMDAPGGPAIRCFKAGVAFPVAWQTYCTELRTIVNGTASPMPTALPTQPAYPAGT